MSSERRKTQDIRPEKFGLRPKEKAMILVAGGISLLVVLLVAIAANFRSQPADAMQTSQTAEEVPSLPQAPVKAYAPTEDITAGTPMSTVQLKELYWPRGQIPEGAIKDPAEVQKLYARIDLAANVPIQRSSLTEEISRPSLPLTPGNRAVAIEVDDISGVEGHTLPGTRVDVVLTASENGGLASSIIVQNARVISYGGRTSLGYGTAEDRKLSKAKNARTLSLDVTVQDALKIQTARQMGKLSLIMRSIDDSTVSADTRVSGSDVQAGRNISNSSNKAVAPAKSGNCQKGKMKMGGKDYLINCDGSLVALEEQAP
jgi:pilus assembly protein CpaB